MVTEVHAREHVGLYGFILLFSFHMKQKEAAKTQFVLVLNCSVSRRSVHSASSQEAVPLKHPTRSVLV